MTADLDSTIRTLVRTAVESAPPAPTVDELLLPRLVTSAPDHRPRRRTMAAVGLVAAAAVVAAVVVRADRQSERVVQPSDPTEPALPGLPAHALPAVVPDGWTLVDVIEGAGTPGQVTRPAITLFRRSVDGAAVQIAVEPLSSDGSGPPDTEAGTATTSAAEPVVGSTDRTSARFDHGSAAFTENGARVRVRATGLLDTDADAFLHQLHPRGAGAELTYLNFDPGWQWESAVPYLPPAEDRTAYGVLVYRGVSGAQFTIVILREESTGAAWQFGVPVVRDGATVFVAEGDEPGAASSISRQVGLLVATAQYDEPGPLAEPIEDAALTALVSLDGATELDWDRAQDELARRYAAMPETASVTVGNVLVTRHAADRDEAVCATLGSVTRCHQNPTVPWQSEPSPFFDVDMVVDGRWVHVGGFADGPVDELSATVDHGTTAAGSTDTGDGVLYAVVASDEATTMQLHWATAASSNDLDLLRPVR